METVRPNGLIGAGLPRSDALPKVMGTAKYGADFPVTRVAYACLVTATVALGRIREMDESQARAVNGVLDIFTHRNVGKAVKGGGTMLDGGYMAQSIQPLKDERIYFAGQIVAVVIAETLEAAQEAAALLSVSYDAKPATATFSSPGAKEVKAKTIGEREVKVGDFGPAFATAAVTIDERYETPPQHHNPMELFQCTCAWEGENLTVWESSQSVTGYQYGLAKQLGIKPKQIHVISPYVGGAFGSRGELAQSTALVAFAAKKLGRAVKLVATRQQGFTLRTFRAETQHHVRLGATPQGNLTALGHDGRELTSRIDHFALSGIEATTRLYNCPNIEAHCVNVEADRQTPGFMRAPPEWPYLFALECAMDELAYKLNIDPIELRKRNDTMIDPVSGHPFTSRSMVECFDIAAEKFGWSKRNPKPGSMRQDDYLMGWGCATAFYPSQIAPAMCRITLTAGGEVTVETGTHEIGTGAYTIIGQTAADLLGVRFENVRVRVGDSRLPAAPLTAGSSGAASVCNVVAVGCEMVRSKLASAAVKSRQSPFYNVEPDTLRMRDGQLISDGTAEPLMQAIERAGKGKPIIVNASNNPEGAPPVIGPALVRRGKPIIVGGTRSAGKVSFAFGAQLVEVKIHRLTGEIRVSRAVGAFAAGRILNARTARSQLMGGQVWGISSALLEATEIDQLTARYVNENLADYLIAMAADVPQVETIIVPEEDDRVNPMGIKGIGEIGNTGMNAAIVSAVFHATGVRVRKLPVRLENILGSEFLQLPS